jgi:hypothetical protein
VLVAAAVAQAGQHQQVVLELSDKTVAVAAINRQILVQAAAVV